MTLWDLLNSAQYTQTFSIYTRNAYDQNLPIARGTRPQMLAIGIEDGEESLFVHLMDKVDYYSINKSGVIVVFLNDEDYDKRTEEFYNVNAVKKWKDDEPDTRPWLYRIETEEYTDKYIDKFPVLSDKVLDAFGYRRRVNKSQG